MKPPTPGFEGERRQVTAVFVDLESFSALTSTWDAEDLQCWLDNYYHQAREVFEAAGGTVTEYLGDGVVAVFGLIRADEHSAIRAVEAARQVVHSVDVRDRQGSRLRLRAGVATGEAAVRHPGDGSGLPRLAGAVTTLAQRLQAMAKPGAVVISDATLHLLRGQFTVEPVEPAGLKGFADAAPIHQVTGRATAIGLALPRVFVGRSHELALLDANEGPVLVVGQAGIGKSALVARYAAALCRNAGAALVLHGTALSRGLSYLPFRNWLIADLAPHKPDFAALNRAHPLLSPEDLIALALVLGLPEGQRLTLSYRGPVLARRIETALWRALQSRHHAGLLVFEDVHWFDAASLGVLLHIATSPIADLFRIVMTSREAHVPGLTSTDLQVQRLELDPLPAEAMNRLLSLLAPQSMDAAHLRQIAERSAGVPLYAEQLLQHGADGARRLPATLTDLIGERIDSTGAARPVLQRAAALGRGFTTDMLRALDPEGEHPLPHLQSAEHAGVLVARPDGSWDFAHALLAQGAYQSMLRGKAQALHARIAELLQQNDPRFLGREVGLLADHLRKAGQTRAALASYLDLSKALMLQGSVTDAEGLARQALQLCGDLAPEQVPECRIAAHTALGTILSQVHGYAAESVRQEYQAALDVASQQDVLSLDSAASLFGGISQAVISADLERAGQLCVLLDGVAHGPAGAAEGGAGDEARFAAITARLFLGFFLGDCSDPQRKMQAMRDLGLLGRGAEMVSRFGMDLIGTALEFGSITCALRGEAPRAVQLVNETDAHVTALDLPVMKPCVLVWGAVPLFYAGAKDEAIARLTQGIAAAEQQGAVFWQIVGRAFSFALQPDQLRHPEGRAAFAASIAAVAAVGARVVVPYFQAILAAGTAEAGDVPRAMALIDQAVKDARRSGMKCWFPEILRLQGRIFDAALRNDEAARARAEAADLARQMGAEYWLAQIDRDVALARLATASSVRPPRPGPARSADGHRFTNATFRKTAS